MTFGILGFGVRVEMLGLDENLGSLHKNENLMTRFENRVQFQGSRCEKILEGTKLGQMECTEVLRPRDGLPEHFGI